MATAVSLSASAFRFGGSTVTVPKSTVSSSFSAFGQASSFFGSFGGISVNRSLGRVSLGAGSRSRWNSRACRPSWERRHTRHRILANFWKHPGNGESTDVPFRFALRCFPVPVHQ
jgi:hypothetical protein